MQRWIGGGALIAGGSRPAKAARYGIKGIQVTIVAMEINLSVRRILIRIKGCSCADSAIRPGWYGIVSPAGRSGTVGGVQTIENTVRWSRNCCIRADITLLSC